MVAIDNNHLPRDFCYFIRDPGFIVQGYSVKISHYMNLDMPETCKAPDLFDALSGDRFSPNERVRRESAYAISTAGTANPDLEWNIMRKGQGFYECYIKLWNWLIDYADTRLQNSRDMRLRMIYERYLGVPGSNGLQRMMDDGYFGYECLGFVANYLRFAGVRTSYESIKNGQWQRVFDIPVNENKDIEPATCIEWVNNTHVAIVHSIDQYDDGNGMAHVAISQSSSGGPQTNDGVDIKRTDRVIGGARVWTIQQGGWPKVPVWGDVFLRKSSSISLSL